MRTCPFWTSLLLCCSSVTAGELDLSGNVDIQWRGFAHNATFPEQHNAATSVSLEPELYFDLDKGYENIVFTPFYRYDQYDDKRSHGDIRELYWQKVYDQFQLRAGISKVYWGVTESIHLVDIINQTDQVENVDGEDKLGQPMIFYSTEQDWGLLDVFVLPGFRTRTFAGIKGRPRFPFAINGDAAIYESADREHHVDYALRLFKYLGDWEVGLSYFKGTGREPESYRPVSFDSGGNPTEFAPYYAQIDQLGVTVQALINAWTWKLEAISRRSSVQRFNALAAGFEYTLVGIQDSNTDLGIVIEYLYDQRDTPISNPTLPVPATFQNDLTTAFRFAFNDIQSSEILIGLITDLDNHAVASFIEASRRLGSSFKAELELRTFNNTRPGQPLDSFRNDDFIQLSLAWYF